MARASGGASKRHETRALVLRVTEYAESDLVLALFTESLGRVSALARAARKSRRRFGGSLEPMHTLKLHLEERPRAELLGLREAAIDVARLRLTADLDRMTAAGKALSWIRRAAPPRVPEPATWRVMVELLDALDDRADTRPPRVHLAEGGLRLLGAFGWGLDLERCVACGTACETGRSAMVDPVRGGLVCRRCGGAATLLSGARRERLARAAAAGDRAALLPEDATTALDLVDRALSEHAGLD